MHSSEKAERKYAKERQVAQRTFDDSDVRTRRAHLIVGLMFLVIFMLTGQSMDRYLGHLQDTPATQRMLYRSTHIYLLWSALLNTALGIYLRLSPDGTRRVMQQIGRINPCADFAN